ncbi:hypothetical protein [Fodinicola acaciae]|uniref:hypothetical protein n=1 Tax=Fodinicola acaciae TaxID=2681555 RepID=UPI0013D58070|nr:hypothetical protein [Fodinicola acaciae]
MRRAAALAVGAGIGLAAPLLSELRVRKAARPLTSDWRRRPVCRRGVTRLGLSFRPLQAEALGLDAGQALKELLSYPYETIRLAAYWDRMEPAPGQWLTDDLDRQLDAAQAAGKQVILCLGPVKAFGYPEFFVPPHHLRTPLAEGSLVERRDLLEAAAGFAVKVVERYRDRRSIVAWQVEHEATDPLGMEHSWRLSTAFVRAEVEAVRAADPGRPVMMNGFLPTSTAVRFQQWWRTRDQGDSLDVAMRFADIVGIDYYPRHAVTEVAGRTVYLDGSRRPWLQRRRKELFDWAAAGDRQLIVAEGQAEPWETVTVPPNPTSNAMFSCLPENLIDNYNRCMRWSRSARTPLSAYLFWGAEYWLLRHRQGDSSYLRAFERVLNES